MLLRVLSSIYPLEPDPIHQHIQDLVLLFSELDHTSKQHLLRLLQMISNRHPQVLTSLVPPLIGHLSDASLNDALLAVLVDVAQVRPASLSPFLPALRIVGQKTPALLGHVAKIHGAVGLSDEDQARNVLQYLVSLLVCVEHSAHHTVLLEIHSLTERYTSIMSGDTKDLYRMSNSFSAIARLLGLRLQSDTSTPCSENTEVSDPERCESHSRKYDGDQVKIQAFEEKLEDEVVQLDTETDSLGPQRCHSPSQDAHDERRDIGFNRSKSLALHVLHSRSTNPDLIQDGEAGLNTEDYLTEAALCPEPSPTPSSAQEEHRDLSSREEEVEMDIVGSRERDRLWKHLRENLEKIRTFCADMVPQIPIPEHCIIEDTQQGCVAQLSFSCPMKGHYCLYGKSSLSLCSGQPHLWIRIMLLALQSKMDEPLSSKDVCVRQLRRLWEKMQLKGAHSFELAMTQTAVPLQKLGVEIYSLSCS